MKDFMIVTGARLLVAVFMASAWFLVGFKDILLVIGAAFIMFGIMDGYHLAQAEEGAVKHLYYLIFATVLLITIGSVSEYMTWMGAR